jgi:hypothetical protein
MKDITQRGKEGRMMNEEFLSWQSRPPRACFPDNTLCFFLPHSVFFIHHYSAFVIPVCLTLVSGNQEVTGPKIARPAPFRADCRVESYQALSATGNKNPWRKGSRTCIIPEEGLIERRVHP